MALDLATDAALRESEERYHTLLENSPSGILVYQGGKIIEINAAGTRLFGDSAAGKLIGKALTDFVRPECRRAVKDQLQLIGQGRGAEQFAQERFLRLEGRAIQVEVTAFSLVYLGEKAVQLIFRDVSERR